MTPIDFIDFDGDSSPNDTILELHNALNKDIKIIGVDGEYTILSYYIRDSQFVLDIQKADK